MMYFLDFDRTLFDTDAFVGHLMKRADTLKLKTSSEEQLAEILNTLSEQGELAFAPGELKKFVYADVPETLRSLGNEAVILTYGNPTLQKLKITNALEGIPRISVLYTGNTRKGEFMQERIAGYGVDALHVDDRIIELENLSEHVPHIRLFEMRRDGELGDGRWPVIHSLSELP
jgi:hypothetical protein